MTEELWRDVPDYEGLYQVSNLGRVKSMDMKIDFYPMGRKQYTQIRKGRILKKFKGANKQLVVHLYKDGEDKYIGVHRLVAEAFIPNPMNYKYVDFINGDKTDVRLENLKWDSLSNVMKKAYEKNNWNNR